jgi:hypothetical protein
MVCVARVLRGPSPDLFLLGAALGAGWFFFTPRAHEYHAFFVLPFLAVAWPSDRRLLALYGIASLSLFMNLVLHDPLVVGWLAAPPDPAAPLPAWFAGLTLLNTALFLALFVGLMAALRWKSADPVSGVRHQGTASG